MNHRHRKLRKLGYESRPLTETFKYCEKSIEFQESEMLNLQKVWIQKQICAVVGNIQEMTEDKRKGMQTV